MILLHQAPSGHAVKLRLLENRFGVAQIFRLNGRDTPHKGHRPK
jgi:hypothetical protein